MAELYEVLDPRPNAASAPYTFFLPDPELVEATTLLSELFSTETILGFT